ncbi:hypothetical protein [Streptomyces chiangmaiensis]|uniref:hypothetical protein n=1 Tax=Streptomyces chiangmaiensis TaxID=766497 RepID=UPI0038B4D0FE
MEEAAESVMSADVEAVESVWFGDRFGARPQGCSAVQGAVRPMLIVEGLELAERVEQVVRVPKTPSTLCDVQVFANGRCSPGLRLKLMDRAAATALPRHAARVRPYPATANERRGQGLASAPIGSLRASLDPVPVAVEHDPYDLLVLDGGGAAPACPPADVLRVPLENTIRACGLHIC